MFRLSIILIPLSLFYILFSDIGCSRILRPEGAPCDAIDEDFQGCYKLETDRNQYIGISPGTECNQIFGQGRGVLEGIGADAEWSFWGTVTAADNAELTATIEGTGEVRMRIAATQLPTGLIIRENGRDLGLLTPRESPETCP